MLLFFLDSSKTLASLSRVVVIAGNSAIKRNFVQILKIKASTATLRTTCTVLYRAQPSHNYLVNTSGTDTKQKNKK